MSNPNGAFAPQGLPNQFAPLPVGPMAWGFIEGVADGDRRIVLVMMTPHSQVNYWFAPEDLDKLISDARAARSGLKLPPGASAELS